MGTTSGGRTMTSRDLVLWVTALTGPLVWFVSLEANFAVAPLAPTPQGKLALYLISLAALLVTAAAGWISWRGWRQVDRITTKALAISGVALSVLFFFVILAQAIPNVMLSGRE